MAPDLINGLFEALGAWFILLSIFSVIDAKKVAGIHWGTVAFYSVWGYWNVFYYPHIEQFWSALFAVSVALTNTVYLVLLIYYKRLGSQPERECITQK